MEIQEPVLKSVLSEVRFRPTPRFPEKRADIIARLQEVRGLENWNMADQFVQALTEGDTDDLLQVSIGNAAFSFENPVATEARSATEEALNMVLDVLEIEAAIYVGVRSTWLAAAESFDELRDFLVANLGGASTSVLEPVGQKPSDVGWVFEFRATQPQHVLRLGPMQQEQASNQIFRDKDPENYPPNFLFLDLDRLYSASPVPREELIGRWGSAFDRCLEVATEVITRLRSLS
ncbi:MAG: hypothetical protein M3071_04030 [Actinomycetota bacterium]|nr:hypothetical protein [Actinomycetota bacterium]